MKHKPLLFSISLCLLLYSCIDLKDNYTAPNWDTELNIPLTNRFYTAAEITKKSKYLSIDSSSGNYYLMLQTDTLHERYGLENFTDNRLNISIANQEIPLSLAKINIPISYPDGIEVDSADFDSGTLEFTVRNTSTEAISAVFTFPNYIKDGELLSIPINVLPNNQIKAHQNLSGIKYTTYKYSNKNQFTVNYSGNTVANGKAILDFNITQTRFAYISGLIPSKKLDDINDIMLMDLEDNIRELRNKIFLHNSELVLKAEYLSDIPNLFDLQLLNAKVIGKTVTNQEMYMTKNGSNNLGSYLIEKGKFSTTFNNDNSNISDFISFLADEIHLNSELVMNPFNKRGSARMTDSFDVKAVFNSWGMISVNNVSYKDTVKFDFDEDARKNIKDAKNVKITLEIENDIPLGAAIKAWFCDEQYKSLFSKDIAMSPAPTNLSGISIATAKDKIVLELTGNEIIQLSDSHFLILDFKLNTYNSQAIAIALRSIDKIKIKAYCSLRFNLDSEGGK